MTPSTPYQTRRPTKPKPSCPGTRGLTKAQDLWFAAVMSLSPLGLLALGVAAALGVLHK